MLSAIICQDSLKNWVGSALNCFRANLQTRALVCNARVLLMTNDYCLLICPGADGGVLFLLAADYAVRSLRGGGP